MAAAQDDGGLHVAPLLEAHPDVSHVAVVHCETTTGILNPIDEVVAGTMHERDGVLTGYLAAPPLVDEARAAWLKQYAKQHGLDLTASYGYGDSHADLDPDHCCTHAQAIDDAGGCFPHRQTVGHRARADRNVGWYTDADGEGALHA